MIRVLIDTNVVLDALASREPFRADAEKLFMLAAEETFQGFVTANSVTDIYYLIRKSVSDVAAREGIRNLLQLFSVIDITGEDCEAALDSPVVDYEDALVAVCAVKIGIEYIVTRDEEFLQAPAGVPVVSLEALLETLKQPHCV